jgi:hypothetical protein
VPAGPPVRLWDTTRVPLVSHPGGLVSRGPPVGHPRRHPHRGRARGAGELLAGGDGGTRVVSHRCPTGPVAVSRGPPVGHPARDVSHRTARPSSTPARQPRRQAVWATRPDTVGHPWATGPARPGVCCDVPRRRFPRPAGVDTVSRSASSWSGPVRLWDTPRLVAGPVGPPPSPASTPSAAVGHLTRPTGVPPRRRRVPWSACGTPRRRRRARRRHAVRRGCRGPPADQAVGHRWDTTSVPPARRTCPVVRLWDTPP